MSLRAILSHVLTQKYSAWLFGGLFGLLAALVEILTYEIRSREFLLLVHLLGIPLASIAMSLSSLALEVLCLLASSWTVARWTGGIRSGILAAVSTGGIHFLGVLLLDGPIFWVLAHVQSSWNPLLFLLSATVPGLLQTLVLSIGIGWLGAWRGRRAREKTVNLLTMERKPSNLS